MTWKIDDCRGSRETFEAKNLDEATKFAQKWANKGVYGGEADRQTVEVCFWLDEFTPPNDCWEGDLPTAPPAIPAEHAYIVYPQ